MQPLDPLSILVVDYRALICSGISALLNSYPDFQVVGQALSAEGAFKVLEYQDPHVIVIDIDFAGHVSGLEVLRALRRRSAGTRASSSSPTFSRIERSMRRCVTGLSAICSRTYLPTSWRRPFVPPARASRPFPPK